MYYPEITLAWHTCHFIAMGITMWRQLKICFLFKRKEE